MTQRSLFDHASPGGDQQVLVDDHSGRIGYTLDLIDDDTRRTWFEDLFNGVPWRSDRRLMYQREVDVPRLLAHYRLDDPELPATLARAAAKVRTVVDAPFNSVGLNLYRDHRDSVAPHNDTLSHMVEGQPVALLSLGACRRMTIRAKRPPRRVLHLDLEPGSLLLMSYATQLHYDHGIAKQRSAVGPRISLAFRVHRC